MFHPNPMITIYMIHRPVKLDDTLASLCESSRMCHSFPRTEKERWQSIAHADQIYGPFFTIFSLFPKCKALTDLTIHHTINNFR